MKPVLLRRTGSALPSGTGTNTTTTNRQGESNSIPSPLSGSGGQIDPNMSIPIADEGPGEMSNISSHKRKQSGIPLEAEAIINRASVQTTSLESFSEQYQDEEEGFGDGIAMTRSYSEADMSVHSQQGGGDSNMPEFSELFPESNGGRLIRSIKSLLTSQRGIATVAIFMLVIAYVTMHHPHTSKQHSSSPNSGSASLGGGGVVISKPHDSNTKSTTIGEYHDEEVGQPMEHKIHEYNKIRFFDSPDKMKPMYSKGPILVDEDMGGLHMFENVCLTSNIDALRYRPDPDTALQGLIYFTNDDDILSNEKRCVPCSNHQPMENWDDDTSNNKDEKEDVGHKCGMNGLHAMFASSVGDWSNCIMKEENTKLMESYGQTQSPTNVSTIHFFQEPTFVLQFNALDMEKSLFDMLMTYLPHWDKFLGLANEDEGTDGFPFQSVISHSLEGCLSHSHNWFCEVLHQMYAFGEAKEIPWEGDENTLYCYRELYYNQVGYQRSLDHEGLVTKKNFGEFREILFRKFGLPRRRTVEDRLAEAEFEAKSNNKQGKGGNNDGSGSGSDDGTKIIFYDNKLSEQTVWNEMESLISKARELEKFQNIKFVTAKDDFNKLSVAQQARKFNEADAVIMAHGQHMANAIFAVDGTSFVEVGCKVESLIGNPRFMELMDGKYRSVEKCTKKDNDAEGGDEAVCVECKGKDDDIAFTMTPESFEKLIDDVVAGLQG